MVAAGLALSAAAAGVSAIAWSWPGALGAGTFGLVATVIQAAATGRVLARRSGGFEEFVRGWGVGMGLRIGGVLLLVVAVLIDRTLFPPLPTALGFLGVLLPLLVMELRLVSKASRMTTGQETTE